MDVNDARVLVTVLAFVTFVGICFWAYSRGAKRGFDQARMLPFADDNNDRK
jgi:cytochrome c oxidase cbb3-type subunit 4